MSKQLGKGLSELFQDNDYLKNVSSDETVKDIPIHKIIPNPYQPRKHFDEEKLKELAKSIETNGVISPIILTFDGFKYVIVAGERRYRACLMNNLKTIPAIIREYSEKAVMEIALLENIQREDLTAVEIAYSYKQIIDNLGLSHDEFARRIGKSRTQVTNMLGILSLPQEVLDMINEGFISFGHARVLSKLKNRSRVIELANKIVKDKISVRQLEQIAKAETKKNQIKKRPEKNYSKFQDKLNNSEFNSRILNKKVVVRFDTEEELDAIIKRLL